APDASYGPTLVRVSVEGGITCVVRSSRRGGSCDDYFPFERASGAAAFSLLACVESYRLCELSSDAALSFFEKRASWLASHDESGRLANHQALAALGLELASRLLNSSRLSTAADLRLERVLSWQNQEGWFAEYDGCDPGYQTLTISCLARLYSIKPTSELRAAIERAVRLSSLFAHPDGSYGGEYGSRNTKNFFPHGFELVGRWMTEALTINDGFLSAIENGLVPCYSDDHILAHHVWNYLLAWQDFVEDRPADPRTASELAARGCVLRDGPQTDTQTREVQLHDAELRDAEPRGEEGLDVRPRSAEPRAEGRIWLRDAGILIDRRGDAELIVALNKGGVFKFFRGAKLVTSDTHLSLLIGSGTSTTNAVPHLTATT